MSALLRKFLQVNLNRKTYCILLKPKVPEAAITGFLNSPAIFTSKLIFFSLNLLTNLYLIKDYIFTFKNRSVSISVNSPNHCPYVSCIHIPGRPLSQPILCSKDTSHGILYFLKKLYPVFIITSGPQSIPYRVFLFV